MNAGQYTYTEIMSQPEAWLDTLDKLDHHSHELKVLLAKNYQQVIFTGCGSTYYLALAAAALYQKTTGIVAKGLPASEIWLYPEYSLNKQHKTLLVAISRSGTTTETLKAVEYVKQSGADVLTLSCYPTTLSTLGHVNVILPAGQEQSIAQTRAFSVLYLATVALCLITREESLKTLEPLSASCRSLLSTHASRAKKLGGNLEFDRFYFLGSGPRYGLACELSLKMKEMTLSHSEPFHFMEFRHGPKSMVNEKTLMIGLLSETYYTQEQAVLNEMKNQGAHILSLGERRAELSFHSGVTEDYRNVLYLPVVQLLAFERSIAKGLNPDKPNHLDAVVVLEV
jgi:glucosamine--fructose-6-phosphate aminotransferase (isomerizing)